MRAVRLLRPEGDREVLQEPQLSPLIAALLQGYQQ